MTMTKHAVLFPINQDEQAVQSQADYLLAQDVFEKIAVMLGHGIKKIKRLEAEQGLDDLDQHRAHEAILLQGVRGSGKSAILVNLALYLKARHSDLAGELLILKPIDPTLLENGENMFLDVFIAALVRDKQVKAKLDQGGREAEDFYDQLCKVGSALESSQTQKEHYGMDRVRALINGNGIADQVHKLFHCALKLVNKKLIVLPIDDVDTALQHAYEKIEIVRKYLVSPCIIPLISGDLDLYNDVIWRDFHGRLLAKSDAEKYEAKIRAKELSIAYQRKILPLPRRIEVPNLASYLNDPNLLLTENGKGLISFPVFKYWLDAILNERVSGFKNSYLPLPINTVREFAQLVSHVRKLLPELRGILGGRIDKTELRRLIFMTPTCVGIFSDFAKNFSAARNIGDKVGRNQAFAQAYAILLNNQKVLQEKNREEKNLAESNFFVDWQNALKIYFKSHHSGGAAYMVLEANSHFRQCALEKADEGASVFDTALFNPLQHQNQSQFSQSTDIHAQWKRYLQNRIPDDWFKNIPNSSVLFYANPEHGYLVTKKENGNIKNFIKNIFGASSDDNGIENNENIEDAEDAELVYRLMTYFDFHNEINRGTLVATGRVFELLITSLVRDVTNSEIYGLIYRSPFYSTAEKLSKNTLPFGVDDPVEENNDIDSNYSPVLGNSIDRLVGDINKWRRKRFLDSVNLPHAWLIYNVFNSFFNTVNRFNSTRKTEPEIFFENIFGVALKAFYAIWNAFATFEKGPIFGVNLTIADMAIDKIENGGFLKNRLYLENILPFLRMAGGESSVGDEKSIFVPSYTYFLTDHPLKNLFERLYNSFGLKYKKLPLGVPSVNFENKEISDLEWYEFNSVLKSILDKRGQVWRISEIMQANLADLQEIAEFINTELSKMNNEKWLQNLRTISSYVKYNGTSPFGRVQRIFLRLEELKKANA